MIETTLTTIILAQGSSCSTLQPTGTAAQAGSLAGSRASLHCSLRAPLLEPRGPSQAQAATASIAALPTLFRVRKSVSIFKLLIHRDAPIVRSWWDLLDENGWVE